MVSSWFANRGEIAGLLGSIRQGDRWRDSDGAAYVVSWVGKMGVVAFRPVGSATDAPELVTDVVRFVSRFAPDRPGEIAA
jgi:hypothetical protein